MNPYVQLCSTIGAQLLIAAFVYGQLSQRVKDQGRSIDKHDNKIDFHDKTLVHHERRISHMEGRKGLPLATDL